jgi:hypothetical protein
VVAVTLAVVLAGCGGYAFHTPGSGAGTETLTPAPLPAGNATDEQVVEPVAPGVTSAGVEDVLELLAAHRAVLRNTSWSLTVRHVQTYENGTVRLRETRSIATERGGTYHHVRSVSGAARPTGTRTEEWSNGSVRLVRIRRGNELDHRRFTVANATDGPRPSIGLDGSVAVQAEHQRLIAVLLDAESVRVTRLRSVDGHPRYRLHATALEDDSFVTRDGLSVRPTDVRVDVVVDARGLVHRVDIAFDGRTGGAVIHVVERLRYSGFGTTRVGPPAWREAAPNEPSGQRPVPPTGTSS